MVELISFFCLIALSLAKNDTVFEGLEPIEIARLKFDAFNEGFKGDELAQNFSICNERTLILNYFELPAV